MNKFLNRNDYPDIYDAWDAYPGASEIREVDGGWMVFETTADLDTWLLQT
jgi:hypothetical protein